MAYAEKIDSQFFAMEVLMGWLMFGEEFGNNPEELARLEKCKWRMGELVFDELQEKLKIPPGDPFTVAKTIGDYLTEIGYANIDIQKVSDTQIMYDMGDLVMVPVLRIARSRGLKLTPEPSTTIFFAAFKKLCNVKAEHMAVPENLKASVPEGAEREMWLISPIK